MITFEELGLKEEILKALGELGFENPTPIQEKAIPHLLQSEDDLVALAQTGTGKTAAFSLPVLNQITGKENKIQTIILSPTRELALQIANDIKIFTKHMRGVKTVAVYGGAKIETQIRQLMDGCQVVVGTPGRVCDMIRRKRLDLSEIKWVVLDEADEMLNMGFKDELDFILEHTPTEKQTLLFSATMPKEIARIAKNYMNNPHEISAGQKNIAAKNVEHSYFSVHFRDKYKVLKRVADFNPDIYAIVFCRTRRETKEIADRLMSDGYNADALHGDLSQAQRDVVMQRFRIKNLQILVATDVAARGIDVDDLTHVINYSLPDATEQYIHRSGRTGRAGKKGISLAIVSSKEKRRIRDIERKIGREFSIGTIPGGKEICERRLMHTVDKLRAVEVNEEKIAPFLEAVNEKLADLDKDALIKRLLYTEFNRFLSYYSNERDILQSGEKGDRKERKGRPTFARFHINLGQKHDVHPARLIGIINDQTNNNSIKIGEIQIFKKFSFFDVDESFKDEIIAGFKDVNIEGFDVSVEPVKNPPKAKSRDRDRGRSRRSGGSGGDRRRGDRRGRGGRDDSFKRGGRKGKKY